MKRISKPFPFFVTFTVVLSMLISSLPGFLPGSGGQALAATAVLDQSESTGSLSGHVYQEDGSTPVANALVNVNNYDTGQWAGKAETDPDGYYVVSDLAPGDYRVEASAQGRVRNWYLNTLWWDQAQRVNVAPFVQKPGVDFKLGPGGSISGHIVDFVTGDPIANMDVDAGGIHGEGAAGAWTDANGDYRMTGLPFGDYRVSAPGKRGAPGDDGYYTKYWEGTPHSNEAAPVTISADLPDISGVDFYQEKGGWISGDVVLAGAGTGIANLHVFCVDSATGEWMGGTMTDPQGHYVLPPVLPGNYKVKACPTCAGLNYVDTWFDGIYSQGNASGVDVTAEQETPNVSFTLEVGGSISGTVYQADGSTPIQGMVLQAIDAETGEWSSAATSDENGGYRIYGLRTASYLVRASPDKIGLNYVPEFYDGVVGQNDATPVPVTAPNDSEGIDFTMDPGGMIFGHVYRGPPLEGWSEPITEGAVIADRVGGGYSAKTSIFPDGSYRLNGLPAGDYRVWTWTQANYVSEYYTDTYFWDQATPLPVNTGEETGPIDFWLEPGGSISGHVQQSDGQPLAKQVWVTAQLTDGGFGQGAMVEAGGDGMYLISRLVPGAYVVNASGVGYILQFFNGVPDRASATVVLAFPAGETSAIDFSLDTGASISGHVYDPDGEPIKGANINAWPAGAQNLKDFNYGATSNPDGSYLITGLPSDSYVVYVNAFGFVSQYYVDAVFPNDASPIAVTAPDETGGIDFTLTRAGSIGD